METLPSHWLALVAVVFLLGIKHGLDPDHLAALNNYATVLAEKGDYAKAIRVWTRALGRDPGNPNIIANIEEARQLLRR